MRAPVSLLRSAALSFFRLAPVAVLLPLSAGVTGCASDVDPSGVAPDAELSSRATAIVVIEGSSGSAIDGARLEGARTDVVARFVRARSGAVDDDALRMVGAAVDFPAVGGCGALGAVHSAAPRALSLLDVGAVSLSAAGESGESLATLQARQLPDVADLISGVVYSTTARDGALPTKGQYVLHVDGARAGTEGSDIAAFAVAATSPGEPVNVRLAGDEGRDGAVSFPLDAAASLTWDAGASEDEIYIDVAAVSAAPTTRCLFVDSGEAKLGASAFGGLEDGTLTIHRLHRESFRTQGVDHGEVRFDFARVVPFSRR